MFQAKTATLGKAANLINSLILSFENSRSTIGFSDLWIEIKTFADKNGVKLDLPFQAQSQYHILKKLSTLFNIYQIYIIC